MDAMAQAQQQSPVEVQDIGLTILHQPLDEHSTTADLVFVHGLGGHPQRTWHSSVTPQHHEPSIIFRNWWKPQEKEKEEAGLFWPADLIPQDCPTLRVLTYGYDSHVTRGNLSAPSKNTIFDHGMNFLNELSLERMNLSNRPIIFVAHSLGGIVVKQALVEAHKQNNISRLHDIYTSAHAVIFFGVPHRGSPSASWALIITNMAKVSLKDVNESILRDLTTDSGSSKLEELTRDFDVVLNESRQRDPLQLLSYLEELGMTGLKGVHSRVVPPESSAYESSRHARHTLHANHIDMCKFPSRKDNGYNHFRKWLGMYIQDIKNERAADMEAERQVQQESLHELMESLDFGERRSRENQLRNLDAHPSTFDWIWSSAFADWLSSPDPLFLLCGKPASGKSTLTQYLVHNQRTYSKLREYKDCSWLIIYFFFDFRGGKGMKNNFEGFLRSLLVQLLDAMPELMVYTPSESITSWPEAILRDCLLSIFDHSPKGLFLFIDGLDEYEGDMLQILRFLKKPQIIGASTWAPRKICVSSRPEPIASELLGVTPSLSMSPANYPGIHSYVQSIIKELPSYIAEDPQWKSLCVELEWSAEGVFLWARCALDELISGRCKGENIHELSERLQNVPKGLEGIYKRMIDRMAPGARYEAFVMLQIACSTPVDFLLQDFLMAMDFIMQEDPTIETSFSYDQLQERSRRVRDRVGGLLVITSAMANQIGDTYEKEIAEYGLDEKFTLSQVNLAHRTVKTFLDGCGWQLLKPQEQISLYYGNLLLLESCSKYLVKILDSHHYNGNKSRVPRYLDRKDSNFLTIYPLLAYSASTLFYHARQVECIGGISSYDVIKGVLNPSFARVHRAVAKSNSRYILCLCGIRCLTKRFHYDVTSPFAHGLPRTCEKIIGGGAKSSVEEALNDAILSSCMPCHEANSLPDDLGTISLLLSKITGPNISCLERAMAIPAPVDVLKLLLEHRLFQNFRISTDNGRRISLLHLLIRSQIAYTNYRNLFANLDLLIKKGENVNKESGQEGTPLDYAVKLATESSGAFVIGALLFFGANKTVKPRTRSKQIKMPHSCANWKYTTLEVYLAGEDGFEPDQWSERARFR